MLGVGSQFLYRGGILCYIRSHIVHVLNVHEAASSELLVNLPMKVKGASDSEIKLMSFQDNIVAVMYIPVSDDTQAVVMAVDINTDGLQGLRIPDIERIRLSAQVPKSSKYFIRHDCKQLIYGYHSDSVIGWHGHREWLFVQFRLSKPPVHKKLPRLKSHPGTEIGCNVVFEIFDDYFYIISTQVALDTEEADPTALYYVSRYKLWEDINKQETEKWEMGEYWRRQHREGPIHDSWTDLALRRDECNGQLVITETRREWEKGGSKSKRTSYTQPLTSELIFKNPEALTSGLPQPEPADSSTSVPVDAGEDLNIRMMTPPRDPSKPGPSDPFSISMPGRRRIPRDCHAEYAGDSPPHDFREFRLSKTKYRSYNRSSQSFLDIVLDDQKPEQRQYKEQIRLRIQSRARASPLDARGLILEGDPDHNMGENIEDSDEAFRNKTMKLWPPVNAPADLLSLTNPNPANLPRIDAGSDERSVIYMTGSTKEGENKPIILVNFDPAIKFSELPMLGEGPSSSTGETSGGRKRSYQEVSELPMYQAGAFKKDGRTSRFKRQPAMWRELNHGYRIR